MITSTIYSIGHGDKTLEKFIEELYSFNIHYLIDVRSKPYSKLNPQFNQAPLKHNLSKAKISYIFLGDKLGGLPDDITCYTDGNVDYDKLAGKDFFIEGLNKLINANQKGYKVAIMCSETDPSECHRSKLIGQELLKYEIIINHIVSVSNIKSQLEVIAEVTKGNPTTNLFGETISFKSRKKYH